MPKNQRKDLLNQIHEFHGGAEKSYNLAKTFWYWPTMKHEIHQMTQQCDTCETHKKQKTRCDPIPQSHIADLLPLQQLNIDYMHYAGKNYLVIVDRATGFLFCHQTNNLFTKTVIQILEGIINQFGTPDQIRCDNAGCFRKTFTIWANESGININHSSPKNSESNGLAEAAVQILKDSIKNPKIKGTPLKRMVFFLNNTPSSKLTQ